MEPIKKHPFFPIFLTVFFGYVGVSLPYAVFPPLFLYSSGGLLPEDLSVAGRTTLLGIALAIYPLGQFFGSPVLGRISDYFGRKKILLISLSVTLLGYLFTAIAVTYSQFILLLFCRLVSGFAEGNVVIAQAAAADLTEGHQKVRSFSFITLAISLGFVIGPIIGGKFADPSIVSWFTYSTPFWVGTIISAFTITTVWLFFPLLPRKKMRERKNILKGIFSFKEGLSVKNIRPLFTTSFFLYSAMLYFFLFVPVYMARNYTSSPGQIATMQAYASFFLAIIQLLMGSVLAKSIVPFKTALYASVPLIFLMLLFILPLSYQSLFLVLPIPTMCIGLSTTSINLLISNCAPKTMQGEVMGMNVSIIVAAEVISSLVGGVLAGFAAYLPFIVGSLAAVIAVIILIKRRSSYTHL